MDLPIENQKMSPLCEHRQLISTRVIRPFTVGGVFFLFKILQKLHDASVWNVTQRQQRQLYIASFAYLALENRPHILPPVSAEHKRRGGLQSCIFRAQKRLEFCRS